MRRHSPGRQYEENQTIRAHEAADDEGRRWETSVRARADDEAAAAGGAEGTLRTRWTTGQYIRAENGQHRLP